MVKVNLSFSDGATDTIIAQNVYVDRYVWAFKLTDTSTVTYVRGDIEKIVVEHE